MRNFKTLLEKDMNLERQMLKFIAKELKTLPDGSKKYHEHLGLMNSETYMETWKKKMILYYWAGVIPGKNLIITADDCHGGIDMQAIMPVIEAELGCLIGTAK